MAPILTPVAAPNIVQITLAAIIGPAISSVPFVRDFGVGYSFVPHLGQVRIRVNFSDVISVSFQEKE